MKKLIFFTVVLSLALFSCRKARLENGPSCIQEKIATLEMATDFNKETVVKKYKFQGDIVYVFDLSEANGADFVSNVLNEKCDTLGFLGGIAGITKINKEEFYPNSTYKGVVWKKK